MVSVWCCGAPCKVTIEEVPDDDYAKQVEEEMRRPGVVQQISALALEDTESDATFPVKILPAREGLATSAVRLLSAVWLTAQGSKYVLRRRQDLPEEAFISTETAVELSEKYGGIVTVSYGWLSEWHPDPTGFYMEAVRHYLRVHLEKFGCRFKDVGVFWDFASHLMVKTGDHHPSVENDCVSFLYAGLSTFVIQVTQMPKYGRLAGGVELNRTPYELRGWCLYETAISALLKDSNQLLNLGLAEAELASGDKGWHEVTTKAAAGGRRSPLAPDDFAAELAQTEFTSNNESKRILSQYIELFTKAAPTVRVLRLNNDSAGSGWGEKEFGQLFRALPAFTSCTSLHLMGHQNLGEQELQMLKDVLPKLDALQKVELPKRLRDTSSAGLRLLKDLACGTA